MDNLRDLPVNVPDPCPLPLYAGERLTLNNDHPPFPDRHLSKH